LAAQALAAKQLAPLPLLLPLQLLMARNWPKPIRRVARLRPYYAQHYYVRCDSSVVGVIRDHPIVDLPCEH
jgi:hypothetical protein